MNRTLKFKLYKEEKGKETLFYTFDIKTGNEGFVETEFYDGFDLFPQDFTVKYLKYECDWYIGEKKSPSSISGNIHYSYKLFEL